MTAAESRRTFPIEIVGNMIEINIHDLRNNYTNQHTLAGHRSINTRGFFLATAHSDINRNDISAPTEIRPEMRMTFSAL